VAIVLPYWLDTIRSVLAFPADHRAEVEKYVSEYRADLERQEAAFKPTSALLEVRRRMADKTANGQAKNVP
jgi:hypothetical protein